MDIRATKRRDVRKPKEGRYISQGIMEERDGNKKEELRDRFIRDEQKN